MVAGALVMDGVTEGRIEVERARGRVLRMRRDMVMVVVAYLDAGSDAVRYFAVFGCEF